MDMYADHPTLSEIANEVADKAILDAAYKAAAFISWLLEEPATRLPAWIAATEHKD